MTKEEKRAQKLKQTLLNMSEEERLREILKLAGLNFYFGTLSDTDINMLREMMADFFTPKMKNEHGEEVPDLQKFKDNLALYGRIDAEFAVKAGRDIALWKGYLDKKHPEKIETNKDKAYAHNLETAKSYANISSYNFRTLNGINDVTFDLAMNDELNNSLTVYWRMISEQDPEFKSKILSLSTHSDHMASNLAPAMFAGFLDFATSHAKESLNEKEQALHKEGKNLFLMNKVISPEKLGETIPEVTLYELYIRQASEQELHVISEKDRIASFFAASNKKLIPTRLKTYWNENPNMLLQTAENAITAYEYMEAHYSGFINTSSYNNMCRPLKELQTLYRNIQNHQPTPEQAERISSLLLEAEKNSITYVHDHMERRRTDKGIGRFESAMAILGTIDSGVAMAVTRSVNRLRNASTSNDKQPINLEILLNERNIQPGYDVIDPILKHDYNLQELTNRNNSENLSRAHYQVTARNQLEEEIERRQEEAAQQEQPIDHQEDHAHMEPIEEEIEKYPKKKIQQKPVEEEIEKYPKKKVNLDLLQAEEKSGLKNVNRAGDNLTVPEKFKEAAEKENLNSHLFFKETDDKNFQISLKLPETGHTKDNKEFHIRKNINYLVKETSKWFLSNPFKAYQGELNLTDPYNLNLTKSIEFTDHIADALDAYHNATSQEDSHDAMNELRTWVKIPREDQEDFFCFLKEAEDRGCDLKAYVRGMQEEVKRVRTLDKSGKEYNKFLKELETAVKINPDEEKRMFLPGGNQDSTNIINAVFTMGKKPEEITDISKNVIPVQKEGLNLYHAGTVEYQNTPYVITFAGKTNSGNGFLNSDIGVFESYRDMEKYYSNPKDIEPMEDAKEKPYKVMDFEPLKAESISEDSFQEKIEENTLRDQIREEKRTLREHIDLDEVRFEKVQKEEDARQLINASLLQSKEKPKVKRSKFSLLMEQKLNAQQPKEEEIRKNKK